jgi:BD-FAE
MIKQVVCITAFIFGTYLYAQQRLTLVDRLNRDDQNKDGIVTKDEFKGPQKLFSRLDRNGNDEIIIKDVEILMKKRQAKKNNRNSGKIQYRTTPTHKDVRYGPHERNVIDIYIAKSEEKTPVMIWIHGGGFRNGDKSNVSPSLIKSCRDAGITFISFNYRLSQHQIAPACFHDCRRALQFVRMNAGKWNLDASRIALGGGSAGAGLSQWLAFRDDMADITSKDPVERESTRVSCLFILNGQTTYDPRVIKKIIPGNAYKDKALAELYGIAIEKLDSLPKEKYELFEYCSPINHISKDDPPILMFYNGTKNPDTARKNRGAAIHHPIFGLTLQKKMKELGIENTIYTQEDGKEREKFNYLVPFLKKHFKME